MGDTRKGLIISNIQLVLGRLILDEGERYRWLSEKNEDLGGHSPLCVMARGEVEKVLTLLQEMELYEDIHSTITESSRRW